MGVDKPKYDFYENAMFLDDPLQADITRKPRCTAPKIGTEPRVRYPTVSKYVYRCNLTQLRVPLVLSTSPESALKTRSLPSIPSVSVVEVASRIRPQHLRPLVPAVMYPKLAPCPQQRPTSPGGLSPRLADPARQLEPPTRIRPTT